MRRALWMVLAVMFLSSSVLFVMQGCSAGDVKKTADGISYVLGTAAPLLPPPFGLIAGGLASIAGVVSSVAASKIKGDALEVGNDPHPVATFFADHHYLYPLLATIVGLIQNSHFANLAGDALPQLMAALGLPLLPQVYFSSKADAKAPDASLPSTTGAPTPPAPVAPVPPTA